jgi:hypothetical protein
MTINQKPKMKYTALLATAALTLGLSSRSEAVLTLAGTGGLALLEEGAAAATAGDPAPANLASGQTAFALDELGLATHFIGNVTNGTYGNSSSWIGNGATGVDGPFIGVALGSSASLGQIAFGRSNVLAGDPCAGGVCLDRATGLFTLQYTQAATVDNTLTTTGVAATGWIDIGTLDYGVAGGTNYDNPNQRHLYSFDAVDATGIRLIVPVSGLSGGSAIDEIELYAPVPEPSGAALLGLGLCSLFLRRRR